MPTLWRVVKSRHASAAFDGQGAWRFGGRWSSPGRRAVYASDSKSLALLELLVHLDFAHRMPRLVAYAFEVDGRLIQHLPAGSLPRHWRSLRGQRATRQVGEEWLSSGRWLALAVPSAIVPEQLNYLLNPEHPGFRRLDFGKPMPFVLDDRLVDRGASS